MKKVPLLVLVVILVIIGLPLPVGGMAGMGCGDCDLAPLAHAPCAAVLAGVAVALWAAVRSWSVWAHADGGPGVLLRFGPDRPPRLA